MFVPVIKYSVDWNTRTNAYRILVQHDVANPLLVPLPINSEMEFIAALIMLGKPRVMIDNLNLVLHVPARSPGT